MNFSAFLSCAALRTRSIPDDGVARSCARTPCGPAAFPSAPALGSTHSASGCPDLFAGFAATMAGSDFSSPFIAGYGVEPSPTRTGGALLPRPVTRSPGSRARSVHACWGLCPRRADPPLAMTRRDVLPSRLVTLSAPGIRPFRGSMASLRDPLPTLRLAPHGTRRTARGRCDSLGLHRGGLAPPAPCRSPGALPTAIKNDRWYESLFGAPPQLLSVGNPARDTNRRNRWKSQRFRRLVLHRDSLALRCQSER